METNPFLENKTHIYSEEILPFINVRAQKPVHVSSYVRCMNPVYSFTQCERLYVIAYYHPVHY
jgi:hypothetical protein